MNKFFSGKGRLTAGRLLSVLLLVVLVLFYGCPNPSSSSSREKEPFPGGELEGSAAITGIYKIGETLTADTSAITGNDGSFEYQWLADGDKITGAANATYTIRGADVSKVISVVITSTSATGQITATGEKVPYTIKIEINGAAADDYVSFSDTDSIVETTALEGQVTIYYAVAADKRNNELQFTGAIIPLPKVTGVVEDGIIVYTIDPDDAKDGVITIKAEYKHTDLDIDDIEFGNTANPITVFYGDGDNSFTNTITNSHNGTGTISYTSSNTDIATVDNNTGVVTILKTGTAIITAEKADDAIYAGASASYSLIISPKPVSITGLTAANKVYNGDTTTAVTGTAVISGNIDGANLTVVNGTAAFTDKNVGTDKTVTFSGFSLGGAAAGNYILSDQPANTTADITRLQLVIAAPSGSPTKIYNGNTEYTGSGITPGSLTNLAAGDTVNVSIASATYNNANVASATQITIVYGISGADAGNYFAPVNGTIAATITRATPDVNWPTGLMASEGDTLGHIALPGNGDGTPGSFSWTEGSSTLVGAEGSQLHNMTFTPTNTANYNTTSWNVTVIVGPPLLSDVVLSPSPVTFTGITYGDSQPAAQTVTITNNGTAAAAVSDISLGGASPESYTLGGSTPTSIPEDGGTVTFTIQPNANLDAGTHNAVVTVTYDGSETVWANVSITVDTKPVSITGVTAANKVYDGDTTTAVTGTAVISGNIDGANLTVVDGTAAFTDKNVGTGKTVTFSGFSLGGTAAGNYTLSDQPANTTADITRLQLTIAAPSGSPTKVYDGNTNHTGAGITLGALTNRAGSDVVSAAVQSASYNNANVASATQITIVYSISGSDSGNYDPPVNGTIAATITKANPTVTWPTNLTANEGETLGQITLPGNGSANITGSWSWTTGDTTPVGAEGSRSHSLTFTPSDSGNYNSTSNTVPVNVGPPLSSDVVLSPSPVSFTGITYGDSQPAARTVTITNNGTAPAIVSGITLNGVSPGSYTLGGTLNPTIGAGSSANFTVRPNANLPAGAHNAVITVTYDGGETITANVTLNVARKPVTITGLTAANKVYDGGTTATATGTAVISGNNDGANLTVSAGTAAFNTKDAGNGKTVTFSGFSLSGSAAANYELSDQPANTTADITKLQLTIAAPIGSPTKVYDGNTNYTGAGITPGSLTNLAAGDTVNVSIASATYNNANVASANQITIVYSISGTDAGNYLEPVNGTIAANITKANPTVTWPTNLTANEGETLGQITLPGNGSANITGSWSWTTGDTTPVGAEGSRSHSLTFTPSDSGNYNSTSNTVPVNVGPPLSSDVVLSPSPVTFTSITYGDSQPAAETVTITNNGTASAIVSGITLNGASPGSYTLGGTLNPTIGTGSSADFTVRPNANLPAGMHNAVITVTYDGGETITANVTLNVARKPVTITGLTAANKVYDGGTTATATGTAVISGNIDGASLTVSAGTAAFNNKDAGNGKTVTFSGYSLGGSAAANYELSGQPANTSANITKLQLTIAAPSGSPTKVYDGNTAYTGSGITLGALTNRVGSDVVSAAIQSATYNNANVASANQITIVYSISGSDSGNYDPPVNGTIAATITKANPSVTWPTGLTATVGQTLGDIALPGNGSANMTGSWSWTAGDSTSVGSAGIQPHNVTFTPTDTANYNTVSQNVNITVAAPPTHNTTFTLNFNHLQDENSLLPWQITGGGSGVLTLSRSGSGIDLELSGYPNITWEVDGVVKSTISTISLNPGDFTVFDEGSHILYVEVQTGGISYGRSIQFVVEP